MVRILVLDPVDLRSSLPSGIKTFILNLIETSTHAQWQILGMESSSYNESGVSPSFDTNEFEFQSIGKKYRSDFLKIRIPDSILYCCNLLKYRNRIEADLLHSHKIEIGFVLLMMFPQISLVQFVHNSSSDLTNRKTSGSIWRFLPKLHSFVTKFVYSRAFRVVTFTVKEFDAARLHSDNVLLARNGYDSKVFFWNRKLVDMSQEKQVINVLWAGRFEFEKNPEFSLSLTSHLVSTTRLVRLHLVGSGSLEPKLRAQIQKEGIGNNVTMHGILSKSELSELMNKCDVFLQTSHYEGSPNSVLEALACGLPVVTIHTGDPDRLIQDHFNGFRIIDFDKELFSEAIERSQRLDRDSIAKQVVARSIERTFPELSNFATQLENY